LSVCAGEARRAWALGAAHMHRDVVRKKADNTKGDFTLRPSSDRQNFAMPA
jgi:hypothetical protein